MRSTKILVVVALSLLLLVSAAFFAIRNTSYSAKITVEIAPFSSVLSINKKVIQPGIIKVKPGDYMVVVNKTGFVTRLEKITVAKGENKYVGLGLISNSPATKNWYVTHPQDGKILEGISSKKFDIRSKNLIKRQPFLKLLPFTAAGLEFKIDYGASQRHSDSELQAIYVTANTSQAQQDALTWIRSQGYNPVTMEIIYESSGVVGQPTNNSNTSL